MQAQHSPLLLHKITTLDFLTKFEQIIFEIIYFTYSFLIHLTIYVLIIHDFQDNSHVFIIFRQYIEGSKIPTKLE